MYENEAQPDEVVGVIEAQLYPGVGDSTLVFIATTQYGKVPNVRTRYAMPSICE